MAFAWYEKILLVSPFWVRFHLRISTSPHLCITFKPRLRSLQRCLSLQLLAQPLCGTPSPWLPLPKYFKPFWNFLQTLSPSYSGTADPTIASVWPWAGESPSQPFYIYTSPRSQLSIASSKSLYALLWPVLTPNGTHISLKQTNGRYLNDAALVRQVLSCPYRCSWTKISKYLGLAVLYAPAPLHDNFHRPRQAADEEDPMQDRLLSDIPFPPSLGGHCGCLVDFLHAQLQSWFHPTREYNQYTGKFLPVKAFPHTR